MERGKPCPQLHFHWPLQHSCATGIKQLEYCALLESLVSATNREVAMATGTRGLCPLLSQPRVTELMTEMPVRCRLGEDGKASKCFALWGRGWRLADLRELDRIVP